MRNEFGNQLSKLKSEMVVMGNMCEEAIDCAVKALFEDDKELSQRALTLEAEIDEKEKEIERMCIRLLLTQQPVASDLRAVSAALKMISDMERIGDHGEDIAELTEYIRAEGLPQEENLMQMADAATAMVAKSMRAFANEDSEMARQVIDDDDQVDALFLKVKEELAQLIGANHEKGELYLDLLMIAKYLERVADHATNIGEWVVYGITGKHCV